MDNFRRRPPMEGFSRPGSLGGEAWNDEDDSVEGHIMSDDKNLDTEGHGYGLGRASDEEDTEGHGATLGRVSDDEDTEGHAMVFRASDEDDTEGHGSQIR